MASQTNNNEPSNLSQGLHNLVTGLTIQSPSPQPSLTSLNSPAADQPAMMPASSQPPAFSTPTRSIFSSGPPTSSVSPSVARASLSSSAPSGNARRLSGLPIPSTASSRSSVILGAEATGCANGICSDTRCSCRIQRTGSKRARRLPTAEKEVDDPSLTLDHRREREVNSTPTALTRLFSVTGSTSPTRHASHHRASGSGYSRASSVPTPLPHHLYTRGFLDGRHSDICIHAFGRSYPLHRLILDRAPFFSSALSEPWTESTAKESTLHPEEIDPNITCTAFELALKRLYGSVDFEAEDQEAAGMFATACWLEMTDLVESSVESLLRQLRPHNLANLIKLVTASYYGQAGERLLSSAKAMLFREGWEMPIKYWDDIPPDVVREIVGGDGFFVPGEWERWILAKRILDRSLRAKVNQITTTKGKDKATECINNKTGLSDHIQNPEGEEEVLKRVYNHQDVLPLLGLLDEDIHYIHLSFEQLQHVRQQKDTFGKPVLPEHVISNALWAAMELRQKVLNASETQMELGLSQINKGPRFVTAPEEPEDLDEDSVSVSGGRPCTCRQADRSKTEGRHSEDCLWDPDSSETLRWLIPSIDSTSVVGESPDLSTSFRTTSSAHPAHYESAWHPTDPSTTTETVPSTRTKPSTPSRSPSYSPASRPLYTNFPPFRFSAEFPNPRLLKERKRVYSRTVCYAGSLWNIYIQKVRSSKSIQLGVYLHRARDRDNDDVGGAGLVESSVDERIGHLEREMLLRRSERRARRQRQYEAQLQNSDESGSSGIDTHTTTLHSNPTTAGSKTLVLGGFLRNDKVKQTSRDSTLMLSNMSGSGDGGGDSDEDDDEDVARLAKLGAIPTLPQYTDVRPTIKTYFKIYSPSRGGRLLSVYESAPDTFNYSQSWGWKSSTLILDDGIKDMEDDDRPKDGRLRFSVVLGNV